MADVWEGEIEVDEPTFVGVLRETARILERAGVPHVFIGGLASAALGRARWTHDIDVLTRPEDGRPALQHLARAGFETRVHDPEWLYKAVKDQVLVDVVFRCEGGVELDDTMLGRAVAAEVEGVCLPVVCPEDLVVLKALAYKEHTARHWFDALALLRRPELDWPYLTRRARLYNPERVVSVLVYARSMGIDVPDRVVETLLETDVPPEERRRAG